MPTYFALLHKDRSHYVVAFPDFPDCEASGASFEDVYGSAAQMLRTHVR
jgi:predicted RNase H-like HicB family nuclease